MSNISVFLNENELDEIREFYNKLLNEAQTKAFELKTTLQKLEAASPSAKNNKKVKPATEPAKRGRKPKLSVAEPKVADAKPKLKPGRKPKVKETPEPVAKVKSMVSKTKKVNKTAKAGKKAPAEPTLTQTVMAIKKDLIAANPFRKKVNETKPISRRRLKQYGSTPKIAPTLNTDYINSLLNNNVEHKVEAAEVPPVVEQVGNE